MLERPPLHQSDRAAHAFSPASRLRSFVYAGRGLRAMLSTQHNSWLHAVATASALGLGFALGIARVEWLVLVLAIVSVWTAEALNTALELLCDVASPSFHPLVRTAKDVAAAAVLICAAGAAVIGLLIFGPRLLDLLP